MRRAAIVLVTLAACVPEGRLSRDGAPRHSGGLTAVWAGRRMLVMSYLGPTMVNPGGYVVKTYDPALDAWRDEPPDAYPNPPYLLQRRGPALVAAGDVALVLQSGEGALYDGQKGTWEAIRAPALDEQSTAAADGRRIVVLHERGVGPDLNGAALFDTDARRWYQVPWGALGEARLSPWRVVGDWLVLLPGTNGATGQAYGGARWRLGEPAWQPMSTEGATALADARPHDLSQALAVAVGDQLLVRVAGRWSRYDPAADRWSPVASEGAPTASSATFVTPPHVLVGGAGDAAVYDLARDTWRPLPAEAAKLGRTFTYRLDDGAVVLLDGQAPAALRYDLATGATRRLDTSLLRDARRFTLRVWTGRCLIVWGGVSYHGDAGSCRGATVPCDPAVRIDHGSDGYIWCAR